MTNAVKHSRASLIRARLSVAPATVDLQVSDDGIGGVRAVPSSIANRLAAANGAARITSPPQGGTALELHVNRVSVEPGVTP